MVCAYPHRVGHSLCECNVQVDPRLEGTWTLVVFRPMLILTCFRLGVSLRSQGEP